MSDPILTVVEGWTGTLGPFTLMAEVLPASDPPQYAPIDLTNLTVTVVLRKQNNQLSSITGVVTQLDQVASRGQVTYSPGPNDFQMPTGFTDVQTWHMHFKVTDGLGKSIFFPTGEGSEVDVARA